MAKADAITFEMEDNLSFTDKLNLEKKYKNMCKNECLINDFDLIRNEREAFDNTPPNYDNNQNEIDKINELTEARGILFK
jgi:hypothetical protein